MSKHYVAGVGFVEPEWKQIKDLKRKLAEKQDHYDTALDEWNDGINRGKELEKMLKEVVFQLEGLVQYISEEEELDDDVAALYEELLRDARRMLNGKAVKPKLGGVTISKLWKEDVKDLHNLLTSYGGHTAECMSHKDAHSWEYEYKCDCGWEEIEKGQEV